MYNKKLVFLQKGQYEYQKTPNFMLIPNPKTELRKRAAKKIYSQKHIFLLVLLNNFSLVQFLSMFSLRLWISKKFCVFVFGTHIVLIEKKIGFYFVENVKQSSSLFSLVLVCWGKGEGDATFILKNYALCPICRKFFVVHIARSSKRIHLLWAKP